MSLDTVEKIMYSCVVGLITGVSIIVGSIIIFEPTISVEKAKVFNATSGTYYEGYTEVEHYTDLELAIMLIGLVLLFGSLATSIITVVLAR